MSYFTENILEAANNILSSNINSIDVISLLFDYGKHLLRIHSENSFLEPFFFSADNLGE